jgi:antitoxin ParD1/3/4/toxin ParE1/3/4
MEEPPRSMKSYRLTPAAVDDLFEIWKFIAEQNLTAADDVEADLLSNCQRVAERPDLGHYRRDLTDKSVRFFTVRDTYLIVYDPATMPLEVIRVLHGARDVSAELE